MENHSKAIFRVLSVGKIQIAAFIDMDRQYRHKISPLQRNCRRFLRLHGGDMPLFGFVSDLTII